MIEKRFLRVLTISFILGLGILLSFQVSEYAQAQLAANPNNRAASFLPYSYYPTGYIGGLGTGLYPGLGVGLMPGLGVPPLTQQISLAQVTPLTTSTLDASYYRDPLTMYGTQARTFTNPFATYGSTAMQYADPFSQAAANTMSYANIFGVSMQQGQGFYRDPFYTTGGRYINYASPVGGFSSDMGYSMTPLGGTTHVGSALTTPWTHYSTNINTAMGIAGGGTSIQHEAFGMPTVFNMAGLHPSVAGTLALKTYGSQTAAMDAMLGNTYFYTKQGMPFIPTASYYNPASVGGSNWFFPGDISYQEAGTVGTGPFSTGYSIVQEVPQTLVPAVGLGLATAASLAGTPFAGYVGGGITPPSGSWSGGAVGAGAVGGGFVSGTGTSYGGGIVGGGAWGGGGVSASPYGGWAGGGAATTGGTGGWGGSYGGWGTVSGGGAWGGGGGGWGGGWAGGGSMAAGGVGGLGGGGSMGGGSYGGAPGAGFGGAPGGGAGGGGVGGVAGGAAG